MFCLLLQKAVLIDFWLYLGGERFELAAQGGD